MIENSDLMRFVLYFPQAYGQMRAMMRGSILALVQEIINASLITLLLSHLWQVAFNRQARRNLRIRAKSRKNHMEVLAGKGLEVVIKDSFLGPPSNVVGGLNFIPFSWQFPELFL